MLRVRECRSRRTGYSIEQETESNLPRCQLPAAMCHVTCQAARGRALACWSRTGSSQTVADGRRCQRGRQASIRLASGSSREVSSDRAAAAPLWGLRKRSTKVRQRLRLAARPGRWVHRATARGVGSCGFSIVVSRALAPSCGFSGVAVAAIPARGTEEAGSIGERAEGELQPEITPGHAPSTGEAGDTNMPASHHIAHVAGGQPPWAPVAAVGGVLCRAPRGR